MSDKRINHYYPASIIAWSFSKDKKNPLKKSKVEVINIPELIRLLKSFNDSKESLEKYIKDNKKNFLYGKETKDIFTSKNLKEENDQIIQKTEREFLELLQKGRLDENYVINSQEQEKKEDQILINFLKLSLKRNVLFTNNFSEINETEKKIDSLTFSEWTILESEDDCAAISDLMPISILCLSQKVLEIFNFNNEFLEQKIYFIPVKSNQWVVFANNNELIKSFIEKCNDSSFKMKLFNILFAQIFMFSAKYIVVGENNWMIDLIIDLVSVDEIREDIIYKRKHRYELTRFFNNIHNLKDN